MQNRNTQSSLEEVMILVNKYKLGLHFSWITPNFWLFHLNQYLDQALQRKIWGRSIDSDAKGGSNDTKDRGKYCLDGKILWRNQ